MHTVLEPLCLKEVERKFSTPFHQQAGYLDKKKQATSESNYSIHEMDLTDV